MLPSLPVLQGSRPVLPMKEVHAPHRFLALELASLRPNIAWLRGSEDDRKSVFLLDILRTGQSGLIQCAES
jgi:hypothetical protein